MTIVTLIGAELRRVVATPLARLAFVALMLVPLIYGGLYLWANRDPYSALDKVPAALVVEDTGATVDGKSTNYGDDIADTVVDGHDFDWSRTDAKTAAAGVRNGDYDFSITLPADFSSDLASASTDSPMQARITLTTSDTNSYLVSTIAGQAAKTIRSQISEQVGEEAANQFLVGLATIRDDLSTALDGATQLADGTATAATGAAQLADGTQQLADGASTLSSGADSLASGLDQLNSKTSALPGQASTLAAGAAGVASGNAQLAQAGAGAAQLSAAAAAEVPVARADIQQQLAAAGLSQTQIDAVLAELDPIGQAIGRTDATVQGVNGQLGALATGSAQVAAGAKALSDAAPALSSAVSSASSGADRLASGADSLSTGAATARDGAASLSAGTDQLATGAASLRDGLQSGISQIPASTDAERTAQAATIGNPVDVATDDLAAANDYGAGLAPFFLSLAGWIGLYALFLIIKPLSRRAITSLAKPWKVTLAGWLTPGILGVVQAAMLVTLAGVVLGFGIANPFGMFAFSALVALTFAAILLALNALLGSVGQFLGLVLMVVQLVTAGGTFPWQTLPEPLAWLHRLLPMSYSVDGYRHLMYGGSSGAVLSDILVLVGWLLAGVLVTYLTAARMTKFRTLRDLRPSLIG